MILNVICDECEVAVASFVVQETKWKSIAMCRSCLDTFDTESAYSVKRLMPNLRDGLRDLVDRNPGLTTTEIVSWVESNVVIPVYLTPWDSTVRETLRDRETFDAFKEDGERSLRYRVKGEM